MEIKNIASRVLELTFKLLNVYPVCFCIFLRFVKYQFLKCNFPSNAGIRTYY